MGNGDDGRILAINGMYTLITYAVDPVVFAVAGKYAKTNDRLFTYRLGIALTALLYLLSRENKVLD